MTFAIQFEGREKSELILEGELRSAEHELGPGGSFTVVALNERMDMPGVHRGAKVFLIHMPDAPTVPMGSKIGKRK